MEADSLTACSAMRIDRSGPCRSDIRPTNGAAAALGTAFYMSRLVFMVFFGEPRSHDAEHAHESSKIMTVPLGILAFLATFAAGLEMPLPGKLAHVFAVEKNPLAELDADHDQPILGDGHLDETSCLRSSAGERRRAAHEFADDRAKGYVALPQKQRELRLWNAAAASFREETDEEQPTSS